MNYLDVGEEVGCCARISDHERCSYTEKTIPIAVIYNVDLMV